MRRDRSDACCAGARCIPPGIAASLVAVRPGSAKSTIGASAFAAHLTVAANARRRRRCGSSGRKVYLATMVVLIAIMREGATAARMRHLYELLGVNRRTVERWRAWWCNTFTASPFWQIGRATFMPPVHQDRLPVSLIERFTGSGGERLVALLRLISRSPEATGTLADGFPQPAEDARRQQSSPQSTVRAPRSRGAPA